MKLRLQKLITFGDIILSTYTLDDKRNCLKYFVMLQCLNASLSIKRRRILEGCNNSSSDLTESSQFHAPTVLALKKKRWGNGAPTGCQKEWAPGRPLRIEVPCIYREKCLAFALN